MSDDPLGVRHLRWRGYCEEHKLIIRPDVYAGLVADAREHDARAKAYLRIVKPEKDQRR